MRDYKVTGVQTCALPISVLHEHVQLGAQVTSQQAHQGADLGAWPLPVLDREGVERQHRDPEPRRGLDGLRSEERRVGKEGRYGRARETQTESRWEDEGPE